MNIRQEFKPWRPKTKSVRSVTTNKKRDHGYVTTKDPVLARMFHEFIDRDVSAKDLADRLGVGDDTIRRWKHGMNYPNSQHMANMAQLLGYEVTLTRKEPAE